MLLRIDVEDFDFGRIFRSGLFYFFYNEKPQRKVPLYGRFVNLSFRQEGSLLLVSSRAKFNTAASRALKSRLEYCLGTRERLGGFYKICRRDRVLKNFVTRIKKTRIISAFTDFEALVGAVVSQNNSYANYRKQMRRLYDETGFERSRFRGGLKRFRLGYKAGYISELAKNYGSMPLGEIKGIGAYSLNLFEIFQKRNYGAFYVDCLTEKIMRSSYGVKKNYGEAASEMWGGYRGLALAFLQRFFEVKPGNPPRVP